MGRQERARRRNVSPEAAFGVVLRTLRRGLELSQDELGFKSGSHRTYIGQLERGEKSPSLRTILNLASVLKVRPSEILKEVEHEIGF